jgi:hypothetical protein
VKIKKYEVGMRMLRMLTLPAQTRERLVSVLNRSNAFGESGLAKRFFGQASRRRVVLNDQNV